MVYIVVQPGVTSPTFLRACSHPPLSLSRLSLSLYFSLLSFSLSLLLVISCVWTFWPPYFPFFVLPSGQEAWVNLRDKRIKEKEYNKRRSILISTHVTNGYGKQRVLCVLTWRFYSLSLSLSLSLSIAISGYLSLFRSFHITPFIMSYLLFCFFFSSFFPPPPPLCLSSKKNIPFPLSFNRSLPFTAICYLSISLLHLLFT